MSEDFMVLRALAGRSFWAGAWAEFSGPMLGFAAFYRPVSTMLLHTEYLLWGTEPVGYTVTQLCVHLLNVALTYRLARALPLQSRLTRLGVAAVFVVYPLHPNTVSFVAASGTLLCTTFLLASAVLYQRALATETRTQVYFGLSVGSFVLALGCYEQAVVLPFIIIALNLLGDVYARRFPKPRDIRRWLILGSVLLLYFGVRRTALGELVGGYEAFPRRLLSGETVDLLRSALVGVARLALPVWGTFAERLLPLFAGVLVVSTAVAATQIRSHKLAGAWCFGVVWIVLSQLPFFFVDVVPATGRYWYLASIGLGICVAAAVDVVAGLLPAISPRSQVSFSALVLITIVYGALLAKNGRVYEKAGASTRLVRQRLDQLGLDPNHGAFVRGYPAFQQEPPGINVAQVFHWGLADGMLPPFRDEPLRVYPLAGLNDSALIPLFERSDLGSLLEWDEQSAQFHQKALPATRTAAIRESEFDGVRVRFKPTTDLSYRLVLVSQRRTAIYPLDTESSVDRSIEASPPTGVVDMLQGLYPGPIYFWLEGLDPTGKSAELGKLYEIGEFQRP